MHPILKEEVSLGTFQLQGSEEIHYYAKSAAGDRIEIDRQTFEALIHADGTRPLALPNKGKDIIPELKSKGIIQTSRLCRDEYGDVYFILIPLRKYAPGRDKICKIINKILPVVSVLTFILGCCFAAASSLPLKSDFNIPVYLVSLWILATICHEMGHAVAGFAYGYKMTAFGVLLRNYVTIGGCVIHEGEPDNITKKEQLQFDLAGIEGDLVFTGIALFVSSICTPLSFTALMVALTNIVVVIGNLNPTQDVDGERALSLLLKVPSIYDTAKAYATDKEKRKELLHSGLKGFLRLCFFIFVFRADKLFLLLQIIFVLCSAVYAALLTLAQML